MITPRLAGCKECASITSLIEEIDCKMAKMSGGLYNNLTLMLDKPINISAIIDLLTYKRILQYKYVNYKYACGYSVNKIASRVKLLKYK
jgi:hypothetical protein